MFEQPQQNTEKQLGHSVQLSRESISTVVLQLMQFSYLAMPHDTGNGSGSEAVRGRAGLPATLDQGFRVP